MLSHSIYIFTAYIIDRIVGDPRALPHPVVLMGKCISLLEKVIRKFVVKEKALKLAGLLFPILIAGGTYGIVALLLYTISLVNHWLAVIAEIWLISTTVATKGLGDAGMEVYRHLKNNDLSKARQSLGMIVGRDTEELDEGEISRGAVETVAENIVDAIISPFCYALIGGAPLAMAYRAVNTLDSMIGYKNEKYQNLGWASARFDDLLNYVPARLTALFMLLACWVKRLDVRNAWAMIKRDAKRHPSPNSGIPEAATAGALAIQLGGTNFYNGVASHRAKMGEPNRLIESDDIIRTIEVMRTTSMICVLLFFTISLLVAYYIS
ncbi:adenosylcobinamide-phosphate synthase CbiB [Ectobacillus panaciterrae]|uniref:adenosylcobinamide-phosphate synthase CbiB n=1 Tax=Ectobacillus panaciterrae TaxID=363872 RepID=UPI0004027EB2|nr:adenosylcobinamide-phosphate synthase CbiB [Ectobacillus panaciterrae]